MQNGFVSNINASVRVIEKSVAGDDASVVISCNESEILTGCSCYGYWGNCDGARVKDKECIVYSGTSQDVTATASCVSLTTN